MESGEFQDWELLVNSDSDLVSSPNSVVKGSLNLDGIEADSGGMIRLDYFSLENDERFSKKEEDDTAEEEGSVVSDNPSWIDPAPETRYQPRDSAEFWSDSGSDRSDDRKCSNFDVRNELGFVENEKTGKGFGEIVDNEATMEFAEDRISSFGEKNEMGFEEKMKIQMDIEGFGKTPSEKKDLVEFWSDSGGDGRVLNDIGKVNEVSGVLKESEAHASEEDNLRAVEIKERKTISDSEVEKRQVVWWKVPFEVFKYYVLRASPVWSFSMAAALMGFVILGRKLYKMKRKTHTLHLKVTVDDKKVSQVMSRADRLNEAFSVVRRVPIVRPLLPAAGVNPWPVMSLR